MGDIYFIVIPVVIIVVILKLCLIFWRIWLYQKRRERVYLIETQQQQRRCLPPQQARATATARVIGVERSLGPEGFTQRTSYLVNQPGQPARQVTRTVVIRPNDNRRPNDPNLPPSYDHAVTGRDKSVKVEEGKTAGDLPPGGPSVPPPFPSHPVTSSVQPSAPPPPAAPQVSLAPPTSISGVPPPEYTARANDDSETTDESRRLLV